MRVRLLPYVVKRALFSVPVMLGVIALTFALSWVATEGDLSRAYVTERQNLEDRQEIARLLGFDKPWYVQFWGYLDRIAHLDLGVSHVQNGRPVTEVVRTLFPATLELTLVSMAIAVPLGIRLGVLAAERRDGPIDHVLRLMSLAGVSLPIFWVGLMLKVALASSFGWQIFPLGSRFSSMLIATPGAHPSLLGGPTGLLLVDTALAGDWVAFRDVAWHLVLPATTLALATTCIIMRMMRSSMLDVLGEDYVRTARAKGLTEHEVVHRHAKRNALGPTTTVVGLAFGGLLGGAVITETIFQWPGLGMWSTRAIVNMDVTTVTSFALVVSMLFILANLVVDVLYAWLDPRVRLS